MKLTLIEKIETYKQMAKEHNDIVPDEDSVSSYYRIPNVSVEDMQMISKLWDRPLRKVDGLDQVFVQLSLEHGAITCFSVECDIKTTTDIVLQPKPQAA